MSKAKSWIINIDEEEYFINFKRDIWFNKHKITVNGRVRKFKIPFLQKVAGIIEIPIQIGEKWVHLVISGRKVDVAMDGFFLGSKKPYVPFEKIPSWIWVFFVLFIAIPIATLGGAIAGGIAGVGIYICVRISVLPNINTFSKVFSCIGITTLAWGVMLLFVLGFSFNPYAGTYNLTSVSGISGLNARSYDYYYIELSPNHTYKMESKIDGNTSSQLGTYKVKDNTIFFTRIIGETKVVEEYTIEDGQIIIIKRINNNNLTLVFTLVE